MKEGAAAAQCLRNCLVVFFEYGMPFVKAVEISRDRCWFEYHPQFESYLLQLVKRGDFTEWSHFIGGHGGMSRIGYRENNVRCSMQIIFHDSGRFTVPVVEVDFDYWNPERGLAPLALHGLEVGWNWIRRRKTNPYKIGRMIMKRREREQRNERYPSGV